MMPWPTKRCCYFDTTTRTDAKHVAPTLPVAKAARFLRRFGLYQNVKPYRYTTLHVWVIFRIFFICKVVLVPSRFFLRLFYAFIILFHFISPPFTFGAPSRIVLQLVNDFTCGPTIIGRKSEHRLDGTGGEKTHLRTVKSLGSVSRLIFWVGFWVPGNRWDVERK